MLKSEKINNFSSIPTKLEELKKIFPEYFDKYGNFLIDKFNNDIQNQTNISKESYSLEWLGKSYARVLATEPIRTLLKENINKNNNSENILIKGDNLEVLKHLTHAYENEIKTIYIDPPYNTGKDGFVYKDNRKFTPEELSKLAGIDIKKAKRILDFVSSKSNSHSAWLTFMYPRLYIARRLLSEDGAIFVSIDENEVAQLKLLMDEIFGEENFIALLSVENNPKGRKNSKFISVTNDFCLIYAKDINKASFKKIVPKEADDMEEDEDGNYIRKSGKRVLVGENFLNPEIKDFNSQKHYSVYFNKDKNDLILKKERSVDEVDKELLDKGYKRYISYRDNKFVENTYSMKTLMELFKQNRLNIKENKIYEKYFSDMKQLKSMLVNKEYEAIVNNQKVIYKLDLKTTSAQNYLNSLLGGRYFDFPKNLSFIETLIKLNTDENDTVLDFFAGSGTTAEAVMRLNAEDKGNRKFILVQLPEKIDPKNSAYEFLKKEDPTIFDITKERVIRAAKKIIIEKENKIKKIKEELEKLTSKEKLSKKDKEKIKKLQDELSQKQNELEKIKSLDLGFKEFETLPIPEDNLKDIEELSEDLDEDLFKPILDKNALLTTWKVFDGIKLHKDLKEIDFRGYKGYYLENILYLVDEGFNLDHLASILESIDDKFLPLKIVINGYVFSSKTQREIFESINNYNKKDLDKIELIIRY